MHVTTLKDETARAIIFDDDYKTGFGSIPIIFVPKQTRLEIYLFL